MRKPQRGRSGAPIPNQLIPDPTRWHHFLVSPCSTSLRIERFQVVARGGLAALVEATAPEASRSATKRPKPVAAPKPNRPLIRGARNSRAHYSERDGAPAVK